MESLKEHDRVERDRVKKNCLEYFRQSPIWGKVLKGFRDKYRSYGKFSGKVILNDVGTKDIERLEGFFGNNFHGCKSIVISAEKFRKALKASKYEIVSPEELLEGLFGEEIVGKQEQIAVREREKGEIIENFIEYYSSTPAGKQPDEIFRLVKCGANEELSNWKRTLWLAAEIYNNLPCRNGKRMYLAVFAAMLIGNPHAFDRGTKEGELLYRVILKDLELREIEVGTSGMFPAYKRQRSYLAAGIMLDDISNYAMLYNVRAIKNDGMPHKGMEGFSAESDIVQVPLNVVAEWKEILCPNGKIHIVENPSVFAVLCENNDMSHEDGTGVSYVPHGDRVGADDTVHYEGARTNDVGKAYMCMNGQPRLAGLMVLDLLAKSGTEVYYSGDLDPESILIAQKLSQYYEGKFNFKHMGEEDYEKCKSEKRISPKRLKMLGKITDERLRPVAERIAKCEMAGYQEKLIEM